jgi:hypothetical protein
MAIIFTKGHKYGVRFEKGHTQGFQKGNVPTHGFKKGNIPVYTFPKGRDNPRYGKHPSASAGYSKHSICDAGYEVSSSYERKVSDWFYNHDVNHIYEFKRFYFGRFSYLPDYYIPELDLWIEVKGFMDTRSKLQIRLFRRVGY